MQPRALQPAEEPFQAVILSEALDRTVQGEAKNLSGCKIKRLQGSFLVPQGGTPQDDSLQGFFPQPI
jgi:hypothetical protein